MRMLTPKIQINRLLLQLTLLSALLAVNAPSAQAEVSEECAKYTFGDTFPCHLKHISWVEVTFQGDHLKQHKAEFEKFLRLRLRNDLSVMKHETKRPLDVYKEAKYEPAALFLKERGSLYCHIWTVGKNDFPIVQHIECRLSGYGSFKIPLYKTFKESILGFSNRRILKQNVKDSLREIVETISADFFETRDKVMIKEVSK